MSCWRFGFLTGKVGDFEKMKITMANERKNKKNENFLKKVKIKKERK